MHISILVPALLFVLSINLNAGIKRLYLISKVKMEFTSGPSSTYNMNFEYNYETNTFKSLSISHTYKGKISNHVKVPIEALNMIESFKMDTLKFINSTLEMNGLYKNNQCTYYLILPTLNNKLMLKCRSNKISLFEYAAP